MTFKEEYTTGLQAWRLKYLALEVWLEVINTNFYISTDGTNSSSKIESNCLTRQRDKPTSQPANFPTLFTAQTQIHFLGFLPGISCNGWQLAKCQHVHEQIDSAILMHMSL